jgi:hypothetical protein
MCGMTKLDLALARIKKLPPERQEAVAVQIDWLLDEEERGGSLLSDEEWAEIEKTLDDDREKIPHEKIVAEFRAKYPE